MPGAAPGQVGLRDGDECSRHVLRVGPAVRGIEIAVVAGCLAAKDARQEHQREERACAVPQKVTGPDFGRAGTAGARSLPHRGAHAPLDRVGRQGQGLGEWTFHPAIAIDVAQGDQVRARALREP